MRAATYLEKLEKLQCYEVAWQGAQGEREWEAGSQVGVLVTQSILGSRKEQSAGDRQCASCCAAAGRPCSRASRLTL
jgi:hypothetical protein